MSHTKTNPGEPTAHQLEAVKEIALKSRLIFAGLSYDWALSPFPFLGVLRPTATDDIFLTAKCGACAKPGVTQHLRVMPRYRGALVRAELVRFYSLQRHTTAFEICQCGKLP